MSNHLHIGTDECSIMCQYRQIYAAMKSLFLTAHGQVDRISGSRSKGMEYTLFSKLSCFSQV